MEIGSINHFDRCQNLAFKGHETVVIISSISHSHFAFLIAVKKTMMTQDLRDIFPNFKNKYV